MYIGTEFNFIFQRPNS